MVDQGGELYNKCRQAWLDGNHMLMYSTHNEGNSETAETFIKAVRAKIYLKMTAFSSIQ